LFWRAIIESELTFLEEEKEVLSWNAVIFAQLALGLLPEVLNSVDVISAPVDERLGVVDAVMFEAGDVENVVTRQSIRIDLGIG